jgi:TonB family protein
MSRTDSSPLRFSLLLAGLLWTSLHLARPAAAQEFQQRPPDPEKPPAPAPKLTKAPKLAESVEPAYPPPALAQGLSADVTLQLDLDAEGNVTAVAVTKPAGNGFDEAAREAALQFRFEPAEVDGKPSPIRIEYVLHFRPKLEVPKPLGPVETAPPPPPPPPPDQRPLARGRMREKGTRDPVSGASVSATVLEAEGPKELFTTTEDDGRFVVSGSAPAGVRLRLVISSGEHEPCVREVTVTAPEAAVPEVNCISAPTQGGQYQTTVINPGQGEDATKHTVTQSEMTTVPGTFGDPLRVIQNLPGIARMPYGLGLLIIRGSSPQDSGVYVDGHRVPLLYHFLGGPSVLTPDLIDRIDFYPGGFGVRYGRASAGVVDVTTRNESVKRVHGSADVDLLDSAVYVEGPLGGNTSGGLAARRSYIDTILPAFIPEEEGSATTVVTPVYWDYQARVTHPLKTGRLSLFAFGSDDSLEVFSADPTAGNIDLGTRIGFHRVIGGYSTAIGNWTSVLSPSYGYDHLTFGAGQISARAHSHVVGLREDLTRTVTSRLKLAVGFDGELRFDNFSVNAPIPPERRTYGRAANASIQELSRDSRNLGTAVYAEALWDLSEHLRLVPGVRGDWFHYDAVDRFSLDPRIVITWKRTAEQTFKLGAGVFHQPPQPGQLDQEFGNPKLPLLWADQYHAGIEQALTRAISLEATLYFLRRHNEPVQSNRTTPEGKQEAYAPDGKGRSYGLELRLRHQVTSKFFGWISYTFARTEAILAQAGSVEAAAGYRPTDFDQTHNFILVASRRFGAWELGTRFRFTTGIPETPIHGSTFDSDFNTHTPTEGEPRSERRQTFHQLDLRAERTWTFDAWRFSAYLDVQNVYNAENPEATIYDYRYKESGPIRGLPILPVIGLRGRF